MNVWVPALNHKVKVQSQASPIRRGSPRAYRAWPSAWPSSSDPDKARHPGLTVSWLRRRLVTMLSSCAYHAASPCLVRGQRLLTNCNCWSRVTAASFRNLLWAASLPLDISYRFT